MNENYFNNQFLGSIIETMYLGLSNEYLPSWEIDIKKLLPNTDQPKAWKLFIQKALIGKEIDVCQYIPIEAHRKIIDQFANEVIQPKSAGWEDYLLRAFGELSQFEREYTNRKKTWLASSRRSAYYVAKQFVWLCESSTLPVGFYSMSADFQRAQVVLGTINTLEPRFGMRDSGEMRFSEKGNAAVSEAFIKVATALKDAMQQSLITA